MTWVSEGGYARAMDLNKRRLRAYKSAQKPGEASDGDDASSDSGADPSSDLTSTDEPRRRFSGLEKTTGVSLPRVTEGAEAEGEAEAPARRVAKLLLLLGKEEAAEILRHLSADEIERVTYEIARVRAVGREEAQALAGEFGALMKRTRLEPQGGPDTALQFLESAFGNERGETIYTRALGRPPRAYFEFLEELESTQLITLFKNEAPPVVSMILAWLSPATASKVLQSLPLESQREVVKRVSRMRKIDTAVLNQIEDAIKEKIRRQGRVVSQDLDGHSTVAAILRYMDSSSGEEIIARIRGEDPELADAVEQQLFTIESVLYIQDADLQGVLRELEDTEIARILKGKRDEIRGKLLANLSMRRRRMVAEEYERLGPVPRQEVDEAVDAFVKRLRELEAEGKLRLSDREDLVE